MDAKSVSHADTLVRIVLTVSDLDRAVRLYRDGLGLRVAAEWAAPEGRGVLLQAGTTTIELLDPGHAEMIDRIEVGQRVAGPVRLAFAVPDVVATASEMCAAGAHMVAGPVRTPWGDLNVRLEVSDGPQVTLFQPPSQDGVASE